MRPARTKSRWDDSLPNSSHSSNTRPDERYVGRTFQHCGADEPRLAVG